MTVQRHGQRDLRLLGQLLDRTASRRPPREDVDDRDRDGVHDQDPGRLHQPGRATRRLRRWLGARYAPAGERGERGVHRASSGGARRRRCHDPQPSGRGHDAERRPQRHRPTGPRRGPRRHGHHRPSLWPAGRPRRPAQPRITTTRSLDLERDDPGGDADRGDGRHAPERHRREPAGRGQGGPDQQGGDQCAVVGERGRRRRRPGPSGRIQEGGHGVAHGGRPGDRPAG